MKAKLPDDCHQSHTAMRSARFHINKHIDTRAQLHRKPLTCLGTKADYTNTDSNK